MIQFVYKLEYNRTIGKRCLLRNFSSIELEIKKLLRTASQTGLSKNRKFQNIFRQL